MLGFKYKKGNLPVREIVLICSFHILEDIQFLAENPAWYPVSGFTGSPAGYPVSGFWISRMSGQISTGIQCISNKAKGNSSENNLH
jgi:hypothetical protein